MKTIVCGLLSVALVISVNGHMPVSAETNEDKRVIITFKEYVSDREMDDTVKDVGGAIAESYGEVAVAAAEVPADSLDRLAKDPDIQHIEEDVIIKLNAQMEDWGIKATNAPVAWQSRFSGEGVKIAVIDSGIAPHADLTIAGGVSTVNYTSSYKDDQGHGTHVAGIIAARDNTVGVKGIAYRAQIYAVKAFNQNGEAYLSDLIEGIDWAITNKMDIVNVSAGSRTDSTAFRAVVDKAYANGLLVVASAGNIGTAAGTGDNVSFPARYDSVIGVAAIDRYGNRAEFSSTGPTVEVAAPGVRIFSTYLGNEYAYSSGTSMATPYVAGMLALMKQAYPRLSNKELRNLLIKHATDLGPAGRDSSYGYGAIQASSFTLPIIAEADKPTALKSSVSSLTGAVGAVRQVTVSAAYKDGSVQDVTGQAVWSSTNNAVATVSAGGRVDLKGAGQALITATFGGQSVSVGVTVSNPATSLVADTASIKGVPGETVDVMATASFRDGSVREVTQTAAWTSSNPSVAAASKGRITLTGYGSAIITVKYESQSAAITVRVPQPDPVPAPTINVVANPAKWTGKPGEEKEIRLTAQSGDGTTSDITAEAAWQSADETVATVTAGKITLTGYGQTVISAIYDGEVTTVPVAVPEPPEYFADIPADYWAFTEITHLKEAGIISGYEDQTYQPGATIRRDHVALLFSKSLTLTHVMPATGFTDVPATHLYYEEIIKAQQAGIFTGSNGKFGPLNALTRAQMAKILVKAYGLTGSRAHPFSDVPADHWADEYIRILYANGVTTGSDGKYNPEDHVNRAQYAVFMYRAMMLDK